jgi:hypothetical protein
MATTAVLNLGVNSSQLDRGINRAQRGLIGFQRSAIGVGTVVGAVLTGAIAKMGWSMIKLASDAEEVGDKFTAVFKGIEKEASIVAESLADSFGLASSTAKELLGNTGDILTGFGFARGEALKMSNDLNKLALDLASFTNHSGGAKGASSALTKALLGETESVKSLGIVVQQGTKDFKERVKQIQKLTGVTERQAKTQAIWEQIQRQSTNAMGNYSETAEGTANRIKLMGERWKELQEGIGKFLIEGLEVDKLLGMISKSMKELADNAHTVRLAFEAFRVESGVGVAKAWLHTKGFLEKSIEGYELMWTKMTGSDAEYNNLKKRLNFLEKIRKAELDGVEKYREEKLKKAEKKWIEAEKKKGKVTVVEAEKAIKKAIEKTTGIDSAKIKDIDKKDNVTQSRQAQVLETAIEKGSIEAFKQEKSSQERTVQDKQLIELKKQTQYTKDIADNQESTTVADF